VTSTVSSTAPSEPTIDVVAPDAIAKMIIEQYQLITDGDFELLTSRNDSARRDPVRDVVEKLTCAQLGELLCTERSAEAHALEWLSVHTIKDSDNSYMVLKDWAWYIISMCIYTHLKDTSLRKPK